MFDIADPATSLASLDMFSKSAGTFTTESISLLLNPTQQFYEQDNEQDY